MTSSLLQCTQLTVSVTIIQSVYQKQREKDHYPIFLVSLIHKSGANQTDASRWSLAYNYTHKETLDLA